MKKKILGDAMDALRVLGSVLQDFIDDLSEASDEEIAIALVAGASSLEDLSPEDQDFVNAYHPEAYLGLSTLFKLKGY